MNESSAESQELHVDSGDVDGSDDVLDEGPVGGIKVREGLPPSFRMRHDAHYVDLLGQRSAGSAIRQIALGDIHRDAPPADRTEDLDRLAQSIRELGVLQPLLVRSSGGRFHLIAGARRLDAAKLAGVRHVPCIVHDIDEQKASALRRGAALNGVREPVSVAPAVTAPLAPPVLRQLAGSIDSAQACLAAVGATPDCAASDKRTVDFARAELERAGTLAKAAAVTIDMPALQPRRFNATALLHDIQARCERVCRPAGITLELSAGDAVDRPVVADQSMLKLAITAAIDAFTAMVQHAAPATLRLAVRPVSVRPALILELSQDAARLPDVASSGVEAGGGAQASGTAESLLLAAAVKIVKAHGGRAEIGNGPSGATLMTLVVPQ